MVERARRKKGLLSCFDVEDGPTTAKTEIDKENIQLKSRPNLHLRGGLP